jgi:hypothetical protein
LETESYCVASIAIFPAISGTFPYLELYGGRPPWRPGFAEKSRSTRSGQARHHSPGEPAPAAQQLLSHTARYFLCEIKAATASIPATASQNRTPCHRLYRDGNNSCSFPHSGDGPRSTVTHINRKSSKLNIVLSMQLIVVHVEHLKNHFARWCHTFSIHVV